MAPDAAVAKFLDHIAACHTARLPGTRVRFLIGGSHVGFVTPAFARVLAAVFPEISVGSAVVLPAAAAGRLNAAAAAAGLALRGEDFDVRAALDGPVLGVLDRGALPQFGVTGVGAHLNGLVQRPDGWHLWVAKRAANKKLDPGKLDHVVAGGVAAGMTPFETLVKEAAEEAGLPAALLAEAREVGRFGYAMERPEGLRRDFLVAYDVVLPEGFLPVAADGEVEWFELWPLARVFETVAAGDDFKFNVNLVLIDLFVRVGLVQGKAARQLRAALRDGV